ncbi:MAG: bifunctional biotin--[acetyl-CoA-carboxylase] ligase/biotin operon repressor BirA [Gammaproteobacteria bacterium]|nr:bifunctional biotin--[acetyl-CoA-carboxylase] ligase/biotin operon repressor BirA [Gammaproteobacteria bacterium]
MSVPYALLNRLADGKFHSGESLGCALGISRSAVWKQMQGLAAWQLDVQSVKGRGYRLVGGLDLLQRDTILAGLGDAAAKLDSLHVAAELDSTNRYLLDEARVHPGRVSACLAEFQSAGRGRRGRSWHSPFAANLCLSLSWPFSEGAGALSGLSLGIGLAVARSLQGLGAVGLGLKWPNDILAGGAKLGGVLIEVVGEAGGPCQVVIGIGLNVAMPPTAGAGIEQAWTDLRRLLGRAPERSRLAGAVLAELLQFLLRFEREGFAPFHADWSALDAYKEQAVRVLLPRGEYTGRWCGVDVDGIGLVQAEDGLRRVVAGDVSLRSAS